MRLWPLVPLMIGAAVISAPAGGLTHTAPPHVADASYTDPPPALALAPFASVSATAEPERPVFVAAFADGAAVVSPTAEGTRIVYASNDGSISSPMTIGDIVLAVAPGPDHVAYLLVPARGPAGGDLEVVALSLTGETTGHITNRAPTDSTTFWGYLAEVPFANTAAGVVDIENGSVLLTPHVDHLGRALVVVDLPAGAAQRDGDVVTDPMTGARWRLELERHPGYRPPWRQGEDPPVRGSDGVIIVLEHLGASPESLSGDVDPTMPVVALLQPGHEPRWFSVPDNWRLASSDVWGTVFSRWGDDGTVELARLDATAPSPLR